MRLLFSLIAKLSRPRPDYLPYHLARYTQLPADRLDRFALYEKCAANLRNRFHDQHPNLGFQESWKPVWALCPGSRLNADPPLGGSFCTPIHTHTPPAGSTFKEIRQFCQDLISARVEFHAVHIGTTTPSFTAEENQD